MTGRVRWPAFVVVLLLAGAGCQFVEAPLTGGVKARLLKKAKAMITFNVNVANVVLDGFEDDSIFPQLETSVDVMVWVSDADNTLASRRRVLDRTIYQDVTDVSAFTREGPFTPPTGIVRWHVRLHAHYVSADVILYGDAEAEAGSIPKIELDRVPYAPSSDTIHD